MNFSSLIRSTPLYEPLKFRLFSPIPPRFRTLPHRSAVADEKYFYHCFVSPCFAPECPVSQGFISISRYRSFLLIYYIFCKKCKMKQITSICSSQIVVSLGGADYCSNKFPNLSFAKSINSLEFFP